MVSMTEQMQIWLEFYYPQGEIMCFGECDFIQFQN